MATVGEVIYAITRKRKTNPNAGWKYHFCVCSRNRLYLFICGERKRHDFPITRADCCGLPNDESYISLNGYKFVPDHEMRDADHERTCIVSDEFIAAFAQFVRDVPILSERERRIILTGLSAGR